MKPGLAVKLRGVRFDGCDEVRRRMLEAKGENYAWAIKGDDFVDHYDGRADLVSQMIRQSDAARDRMVEWHVAESRVADVLRKIRDGLGISNIDILHTPPLHRAPTLVQ
ncbi:MAG: hypothetical protein IT562_22075 [Alphaproteobacteria bacterium]|nr:hypothetical protein [Alphaproteobacteria bacterium]